MTIEQQVYTILAAIPAVTSLVPASRIKVPGNSQSMARPYVVHHPVSPEPIALMNNTMAAMRIWEYYQISVYADSYSSGNGIACAIRDALTSGVQTGDVVFMWQPGSWYIGRDDLMNVEHFAVDFRVAEAL